MSVQLDAAYLYRLRDEIAMQAMHGWIANGPLIEGKRLHFEFSKSPDKHAQFIARMSYEYANCMLAERAKNAPDLTGGKAVHWGDKP